MSRRRDLERLVRARSKLPLTSVGDDDVLGHELGFDSQALLSLLLDIEDRFDLEIPPEEVARLTGATFADLLALVERAADGRAREEASR